jgi:mono/diheme cytochrome c family protein
MTIPTIEEKLAKPKSNKTRRRLIVAGIVVLAAVILLLGWQHLFRQVPINFASDEEHFKYGSIGTEETIGLPYWLWLVLPRMFPEKLPGAGGYASLGVVWEEGRELPIGFTKMTIGFDRVGVNCAACHTSSVRRSPDEKPMLILGGPSHQFDMQAYQRFFIAAAKDDRFNADAIMAEIGKIYDLPLIDKILYRYVIIPLTKRRLLEQEQLYAWMNLRPNWGPGRTDMNPFKLIVLKLQDDRSVGNSDMMPIWNERAHDGFLRHSDGLNTSLIEATYAAALATGATADSINIPNLQRVNEWLLDLPSPRYPFAIDQKLAARGKQIFDQQCASCHAFGQSRTGQLIPLAEVGTDPSRAEHWTAEAADAFNRQFDRYSWGFDHFQGKTGGYVAPALDGVWARAPYLHNGSVPSLSDLLQPVDKRPITFYRGYDVYDPQKVGFVSNLSSQGGRDFSMFDTRLPGNANSGHLYGAALSDDDKTALIEHLKTY